MSNVDPTITGQSVGEPAAPDEFGAELAAVFAARETRNYDADASRADMGGGAAFDLPPGGWPGGDTATADQGFPAPGPAAVGVGGGEGTGDLIPTNPANLPAGSELPAPTPATALPEPTVPAPVVDGLPGGGPVLDPAGVPAPAGSTPPVEPAPAPVQDGWVYEYTNPDGVPASQKFTNEQVERALSLDAWAEGLTDAARSAMGQVAEGQAVAVPRADFDRYQAWLNQQNTRDRDRDLDQFDDDAAAEIRKLRDERDALRGQPAPPAPQQSAFQPPAPVAQTNPNLNANLNATAQGYDNGARAYQARHNLTQPELDALLDDVAKAQIISGLHAAHTQFNPVTGDILRPADPATVIQKALDAAMTWNPALHSRVIAAQQQAANTAPAATPVIDAVATKKANAASLASAPSAATPPTPRTAPLTGQAAVDAMAAELLSFMGSDR